MRIELDADDFAPRLEELGAPVDCAVCNAYNWKHDILDDKEVILARLPALNLKRTVQSAWGPTFTFGERHFGQTGRMWLAFVCGSG